MKTKNFKPFISKRVILPLLAIVIFISTPLYNTFSKRYIDNSLKGAVITYALLRSLNAGVSVIQKSSITLGVGIEGNIAIGEVLDPINDAIERFSDMITLAIWALGSEKALYEVSKTKLVILAVILLSLIYLLYDDKTLEKFLVLLIVVRIFIPFSAIVSHYFNDEIFDPQIQKSLKTLQFIKDKSSPPTITTQNNSNIWDKIQNSISNTTKSYQELKNSMKFYIENASMIISELINLSIYFFSKYLLNLILLPLLLIYIIKNLTQGKL